MKLYQLLNERYIFYDVNGDEVKVGDAVLFKKDGLGGNDGWSKGIISNIDGKKIKVNSLEAKDGQSEEVVIQSWKLIDKI